MSWPTLAASLTKSARRSPVSKTSMPSQAEQAATVIGLVVIGSGQWRSGARSRTISSRILNSGARSRPLRASLIRSVLSRCRLGPGVPEDRQPGLTGYRRRQERDPRRPGAATQRPRLFRVPQRSRPPAPLQRGGGGGETILRRGQHGTQRNEIAPAPGADRVPGIVRFPAGRTGDPHDATVNLQGKTTGRPKYRCAPPACPSRHS